MRGGPSSLELGGRLMISNRKKSSCYETFKQSPWRPLVNTNYEPLSSIKGEELFEWLTDC
jgi:hypothetical protein